MRNILVFLAAAVVLQGCLPDTLTSAQLQAKIAAAHADTHENVGVADEADGEDLVQLADEDADGEQLLEDAADAGGDVPVQDVQAIDVADAASKDASDGDTGKPPPDTVAPKDSGQPPSDTSPADAGWQVTGGVWPATSSSCGTTWCVRGGLQ